MQTATDRRVLTIEGDLVRLERTVVEREVKTSDFVAGLARQQPFDSDLLPAGCVWLVRQSAQSRMVSVYVIERPTGMQKVMYALDRDDPSTIKELALSWPNTLWFVRVVGDAIEELYLTCTKEPIAIAGKDTRLFRMPMPNIYENGHGPVCLGNLVTANDKPLAVRIGDLIRQVLESLWNSDLMPEFEGTGAESLEDWAKKSAADQAVAARLMPRAHRRTTVAAMLEMLLSRSD